MSEKIKASLAIVNNKVQLGTAAVGAVALFLPWWEVLGMSANYFDLFTDLNRGILILGLVGLLGVVVCSLLNMRPVAGICALVSLGASIYVMKMGIVDEFADFLSASINVNTFGEYLFMACMAIAAVFSFMGEKRKAA